MKALRRLADRVLWVTEDLLMLVDKAAYWLYSVHDRRYRDWVEKNRNDDA